MIRRAASCPRRHGFRLRSFLVAATFLTAVEARAEPVPPSLEELVEIVDLSGLAASPDARLIAFRTDQASLGRNSYTLDWHVADLQAGRVRAIGSAGEPIIADPGLLVAERPIWSPDSRWLYYRSLRGGSVQIWRTAADGSESRAVTEERGDVLSMQLSSDGQAIAYRVGPARAEIEQAELAEYDEGILLDEHVEIGQNLFRGAIIHGRHASQRLTGQWFARGGILWARPLVERRLDFGNLTATTLRSEATGTSAAVEGAPAAPELTATSGNGDRAEARWSGHESSLSVTLGGRGSVISCRDRACRRDRIVWMAWRPGHSQLLFAAADLAHVQRLFLWDVPANRVRAIAASEGLLNGGRESSAPCAIAQGAAVCVSAGPASPPRLERVDLQSGARQVLFDPNTVLRARRWPSTERLEWRSGEGRRFTGVLYLPEGTGAAPLFINYYRCQGFLRGGEGDEWPLALLAANGIASVCVNATRMTGEQDGVGQYRWALGGIEALIDRLASRGTIDRSRVGMGGLSFGSEVTMWAVMHSNLISVVSIASPQFEPTNYWFNGVRGRDHHDLIRRIWGLGAPEETPDRWRLLSPALNVEQIRAPVLLQLAEQEARYAMEFYARLSVSTTPTEMHVFPDEPHIKVQPRHRLAVYRRNLDWFRFWLLGQSDEDPARADQYRRWRALAERSRAGSSGARPEP